MRFAAMVALATIFAGFPAHAQEQAATSPPDMQMARCVDFTSAADDSPYTLYIKGFADARGSAASAGMHTASVRQACQSQPEVGFLSMVAATAPAPMAAVGAGVGPTSCSAPATTTCTGCSVACDAGQQAVCKSGRDFGSVRCATRSRCICE
ncbi:hypothetical protein [Arenimonas alkanexedens]